MELKMLLHRSHTERSVERSELQGVDMRRLVKTIRYRAADSPSGIELMRGEDPSLGFMLIPIAFAAVLGTHEPIL